MASILDRYGIKEVADVTFYEINSDGSQGAPVLYLDTLKVSTIEQTAETADARGGKGNPKLITWDYGKEITVSLEDALFSPKSMAIMFGNGKASTKTSDSIIRTYTARVTKGASDSSGQIDFITADVYDSEAGSTRVKVDMMNTTARSGYKSYADSKLKIKSITTENGADIEISAGADRAAIQTAIQGAGKDVIGQKVLLTFEQPVNKSTITISGDSFPGTYYVQGDTYARSDITGKDEFFQFIIPKAKMTAENTITLEADGDPSVFNMNLTVLRPEDGDMMKLVQYELTSPSVNG